MLRISFLKDNIAALENQKQNLLQELEKEKAAIQRINAQNAGSRSYLRDTHKKLNRTYTCL